jgi:hypothetical protein
MGVLSDLDGMVQTARVAAEWGPGPVPMCAARAQPCEAAGGLRKAAAGGAQSLEQIMLAAEQKLESVISKSEQFPEFVAPSASNVTRQGHARFNISLVRELGRCVGGPVNGAAQQIADQIKYGVINSGPIPPCSAFPPETRERCLRPGGTRPGFRPPELKRPTRAPPGSPEDLEWAFTQWGAEVADKWHTEPSWGQIQALGGAPAPGFTQHPASNPSKIGWFLTIASTPTNTSQANHE